MPDKKINMVEFKWNLIGIIGKLFIDLLVCTTRIELIGFDKVRHLITSRQLIFAVWHSRILLLSALYKRLNAAVLVSRSDDGEIVARIIQKQGQEPIRGSTTRGGLRALARLIKIIKQQQRPGVVIPDGPQGPRFKVQPGVITLAKKTGRPILPVSYSAKRIKVFASWDRFILPYPFTRCRVVYGNPVYVPEDADPGEEKRCLNHLETELCRITFDADRYYGHNIT